MFNKLRNPSDGTHIKGFKIVTAIVVVLFVCSVTLNAFAAANASLTVNVVEGDENVTVSVRSANPADIVSAAGFELDVNDELDLSGFSSKNGGTIIINRAKIVRIEDNGLIGYYIGHSETLQQMLVSHEIVINDGDVVNASVSAPIYDGMDVSINRAFGVGLNYDGGSIMLALTGGTVADALEEAGITLGEDDIVSPSLDSELEGFTNIVIKRVTTETANETEVIEYKTEKVADSSMYVGQTKVVTEGENGEKLLTYSEKYIDGEYVGREIVDEEIIKEAVNKVVKYGTKPVESLSAYKNADAAISELKVPSDLELDENGIPVNYSRAVKARATAYTGDPATASGRTPMPGHIAVDPNEYPYGTELYIVSADGRYVYGYCIAADTGGFVSMGNTDVDLYMDNEQMCSDWGNRDIIIYVLN